MVALTHVPLGQEVLKRGIIFIDLAIAQIAALGVVIGDVLFHVEGGGVFSLLLALVFALAGSALFGWLEKKSACSAGSLYRLRFCDFSLADYFGAGR
ncbi:MAG: hypothetical protein LRY39_02180 [Alphaproteobacteria bacterium]|nr:hypothetical protein [Alphaproteobacteria bacterium]